MPKRNQITEEFRVRQSFLDEIKDAVEGVFDEEPALFNKKFLFKK